MPFLWIPNEFAKEGRALARDFMQRRRRNVGTSTDRPYRDYRELSSRLVEILCFGETPSQSGAHSWLTLVRRGAMSFHGVPTAQGRKLCRQAMKDPSYQARVRDRAQHAQRRFTPATLPEVTRQLENTGQEVERFSQDISQEGTWGGSPCMGAFYALGRAQAYLHGATCAAKTLETARERAHAAAATRDVRSQVYSASTLFRERCVSDDKYPPRPRLTEVVGIGPGWEGEE